MKKIQRRKIIHMKTIQRIIQIKAIQRRKMIHMKTIQNMKMILMKIYLPSELSSRQGGSHPLYFCSSTCLSPGSRPGVI